MATEFQMPKLGLTMEEGTIISWMVADGAQIAVGDPVMVIATDKVETEVEAVAAGRLHQIAAEGDTFPCGAVIGLVLAEGEAPPARPTAAPAPAVAQPAGAAPAAVATSPAAPPSGAAGGRLLASPNARRVAAAAGLDLRTVRGSGPDGRIVSEDVEAAALLPRPTSLPPAAAPVFAARGEAVVATVAARSLADLLGIDLAAVPYDPVEGRVTRDGVAAYVRSRLAAGSPAAPTTPPATGATPVASVALAPASQTPTKTIRFTGMRGTIAKRMHASLHEMAQLTLMMDADVGAVLADRDARAAVGDAPGFTDYILAATARALRAHPGVNAQVTPDGIALLPDVHVSLAVAVDNGLIVPVVRHADRLTLGQLSAETTRLAGAARSGSLTLDELEGGTFSVTALGMFGVDGFTPVINPPNVAILGVGRIRDELQLVDGAVTVAKKLTLSLTWDHRVLDGAPAADFCRAVVRLLADPSALDQATLDTPSLG